MALGCSFGVMAIPLAEPLITLGAFLQGGCQGLKMLGGRGGYGSGFERLCLGMLTASAVGAKLKAHTPLGAMSEEQLLALLAKLKEDAGLRRSFRVLETSMLLWHWRRRLGLMSARRIGSNIRRNRPWS